jgi:signal peptidase I
MRCDKCGAENAGNLGFCNRCAAPLNRSCPKCAFENAPEAKFCGQCATPLETDNVPPQERSSTAIAETKSRRVGVALLLSLLFPGWGQIYSGQFSRAVVLWAGYLVASGCAIFVGVPESFRGLIAMSVAPVIFYAFVCVDAAVCARRSCLDLGKVAPHRWFVYLGLVIIVCGLSASEGAVSRHFFFKTYKIPAGSMEPTLLIGDFINTDRRARTSVREDVIVFTFPPDPTKEFVKRVVAIGGDSVEVRNGIVYLNGRRMRDPHAHLEAAPQDRSPSSPRDNFGPVTVPTGKLFVLGDNRDRSYDSRFWGFVDQSEVQGQVLYVYWSQNAERRWQRIGMRVQ